jgi:hypothetical protein
MRPNCFDKQIDRQLMIKFQQPFVLIPTGVKGWVARGKLDLNLIRRLTKPSRSRR